MPFQNRLRLVLPVLTFCVTPWCLQAQESTIRMTFSEDVPDLTSVFVIPGNSMDCDNKTDAAEALAQYADVRLGEHYRVLERKYLDMLLDEQKLGMSGIVYEASAVEAGCLQGSEGVVFCDVGCLQGLSMVSVKLVNCSEGMQVWAASAIDANVIDLMDEISRQLSEEEGETSPVAKTASEEPLETTAESAPESAPEEEIRIEPATSQPEPEQESAAPTGGPKMEYDGKCADLTYDNFTYDLISVGGDCWFAENLQTARYANGDRIPLVANEDWFELRTGAQVVYGMGSICKEDVSEFNACNPGRALFEFGRHYNGWAVQDPRGICPTGWHVPTLNEWFELEKFFIAAGFERVTHEVFRSKTCWSRYNGLDTYGFDGKPAGRVNELAGAIDAGTKAYWWTSTGEGDQQAGVTVGRDRLSELEDGFFGSTNGFSVRCKQD